MDVGEFFWTGCPKIGHRHLCRMLLLGRLGYFNPFPRRPLFRAAWWTLLVLSVAALMMGQAEGMDKKAPSIAFDIAPQPLEAALDAYSSASNVQVLYETSLTSGHSSARLRGLFTPEAALRTLLAGTGLTAWYTTEDSYTLVRQQDASSSDAGHAGKPPAEIGRYGHFLGLVQMGLVDRLCQSPLTRPGQYRIALRFRIGPSGGVAQTTLLNSTGDSERDAEIIAAVEAVMVDEAPPSKMPQPITMVIAPRLPNVTGDCVPIDAMDGGR